MSSKRVTKKVLTTVGNPLSAETRKLEGIRTWKADYLIDRSSSTEEVQAISVDNQVAVDTRVPFGRARYESSDEDNSVSS